MSIDSMSDGASVESGLVVVIVVKLGSDGPMVNLSTPAVPTATPSITYSGWLSPLVEVTPRICTAIAPPGAASAGPHTVRPFRDVRQGGAAVLARDSASIAADHRHPDTHHRAPGRRIGDMPGDRARRRLRGRCARDERPGQHQPCARAGSHG